MNFKDKLSELVTDAFKEAVESKNPPRNLAMLLKDMAIVYSNMVSLSSRGSPEGLDQLLEELNQIIRKNAHNGLENARQIVENMERTKQ